MRSKYREFPGGPVFRARQFDCFGPGFNPRSRNQRSHQLKKKRLYWFIYTHFSFRLAITLCTLAHGVTQKQSDRQASAMNGSTITVYGTVVTAVLEPDSTGQGLCPTRGVNDHFFIGH